MTARNPLCGLALVALLALAPALARAAPPAVPLQIDSVEVAAVAPLEGENLTITVTLTNNASFPLTLSNLTVLVTGNGAEPETVAALANVSMPANNTTQFAFHWVASAGVKVVTATAFVLVGNDSYPLAPVSARVQVDRPQTSEAGVVALSIALVLGGVVLLAVLPALFERVTSREKAGPRAEGPAAGRPPPGA